MNRTHSSALNWVEETIQYNHCRMHRFLQSYIKSLDALEFTISWKFSELEQNLDIFLKMEGFLFTPKISIILDINFTGINQKFKYIFVYSFRKTSQNEMKVGRIDMSWWLRYVMYHMKFMYYSMSLYCI